MRSFISIKTAIPDVLDSIDESLVSINDIIEWCAKAMGQIDAYESYEQAIAIRTISGYQTYLPKGCLQVNQIAFNQSAMTSELQEDDYEQFINAITSSKAASVLDTNMKIKEFFDKVYDQAGWAPMRASTNNFMRSVLCANSPNLTSDCQGEFTILPNGKIITNVSEGTMLISYMRAPLDCDGNYLIPQDDELIETLRQYCMYRIWEKRYNMKEQGAPEKYYDYRQQWRTHKHMMRGKLKLPTQDQYQNILDYSVNLTPKRDRYFNYFGTMNVPDSTFF
jgi:hypothetical protein